MNKIFFLQPRQSGKTGKAIYEYIKDSDNSIFVTYNRKATEYISKIIKYKFRLNLDNIMSAKRFIKPNIRMKKNIILDEYMFFKHKKEIYEKLKYECYENLYIFSTSNKQYNKDIFNFIKLIKQNDITYESSIKLFNSISLYLAYNQNQNYIYNENNIYFSSILSFLKSIQFQTKEYDIVIKDEMYDLYYNFITDSDIKLIDVSLNHNNDYAYEKLKSIINKQQYEIEYRNIYLK